jgi:hypothetical protein
MAEIVNHELHAFKCEVLYSQYVKVQWRCDYLQFAALHLVVSAPLHQMVSPVVAVLIRSRSLLRSHPRSGCIAVADKRDYGRNPVPSSTRSYFHYALLPLMLLLSSQVLFHPPRDYVAAVRMEHSSLQVAQMPTMMIHCDYHW